MVFMAEKSSMKINPKYVREVDLTLSKILKTILVTAVLCVECKFWIQCKMKTQAFFVLTMMSFETVMVKGWPMYQPKPKALGAAPVICLWSGSCSQQGAVQMQHGGEDVESRAQRPGYKSSACCLLPERPCMNRWWIFLWAPAILWCALMNTINFIEHSEHQVKSCIKVLWMCAQDPMYPLKVQYVCGCVPLHCAIACRSSIPVFEVQERRHFPFWLSKRLCIYHSFA